MEVSNMKKLYLLLTLSLGISLVNCMDLEVIDLEIKEDFESKTVDDQVITNLERILKLLDFIQKDDKEIDQLIKYINNFDKEIILNKYEIIKIINNIHHKVEYLLENFESEGDITVIENNRITRKLIFVINNNETDFSEAIATIICNEIREGRQVGSAIEKVIKSLNDRCQRKASLDQVIRHINSSLGKLKIHIRLDRNDIIRRIESIRGSVQYEWENIEKIEPFGHWAHFSKQFIDRLDNQENEFDKLLAHMISHKIIEEKRKKDRLNNCCVIL